MGRRGFLVLCSLLALIWPEVVGDARAAFVWEEVGPGTRKGLEAVTVDPVDPQVVWVTDGTRVWVTDDGGESWQPVLRATSTRTSPSSGGALTRRRASGDEGELGDDSGSDEEEAESLRLRPLMGDDEELGEDGINRPDAGRRRGRRRGQVTSAQAGLRLRVVGDSVYLCVGGGLWVTDRAARNLGTDRRIRFGRQVAVFDVAEADKGALWLSTAAGLMHLDARERATPVRGAVGDRAVVTTRVLGQELLVATQEGLWSGRGGRFERLGLSLDAARDLLVLPDHRVVVATDREVVLISLNPGDSPQVLVSWPMAGVSRLAIDRNQVLWAAGSRGVWSRTMEFTDSWQPRDTGLRDRRVSDVATTRGTVRLWLVGSGGAWRRVSERVQAERQGDRRGFMESAGAPGLWRTLSVAQRQRVASLDHLRYLRMKQSTAWLLPDVNVSYTNYFARDETALFVDELDQLLLNDANIVDGRPEWRVVAYWDLYAAVLAVLELDTPDGSIVLQDEITRVMKDREDLRDQVVPLYNQWVATRAAPDGFKDSLRALRHLLKRQHLEADLFAVTGGWFPVEARQKMRLTSSRLSSPTLSLHQGE